MSIVMFFKFMDYCAYLFVACTSLVVGVLSYGGEGMGLITFGCVACFVGSTMLIIEECLK